jgi:hypothetical protein
MAVGFTVPAVTVDRVLRRVWPAQHDLSDIGTGLFQLILAVAAGTVGALVAWLLVRRTRR